MNISINGINIGQIGKQFEEVSTKFLGIHIDENLTWKPHLKYINSKISRSLYMIRQAKNFLPVDSLKTIYYSMVQPYLSYGILAWGNANKTDLKKTFLFQKRALRIINRAEYNSHTDPLFKNYMICTNTKCCNLCTIISWVDYHTPSLEPIATIMKVR